MEVMLRMDGGRLVLSGRRLSRIATMELRSSCDSVSRLNLVVVVIMLEARERSDAVVKSSRVSRAAVELVIGNQVMLESVDLSLSQQSWNLWNSNVCQKACMALGLPVPVRGPRPLIRWESGI